MKKKIIILVGLLIITSLIIFVMWQSMKRDISDPMGYIEGKLDLAEVSENNISFIFTELNISEEVVEPSFLIKYAQINGTEIDSSEFYYFYTDINSDGILSIGDSMTFSFNSNIKNSKIGINLGLPGFVSDLTGTHYG